LGEFAAALLVEIKSDRERRPQHSERTDGVVDRKASAHQAQEREKSSGLGILEALEFLELGIHENGRCGAHWKLSPPKIRGYKVAISGCSHNEPKGSVR